MAKYILCLGMVLHTSNARTQEGEAGGLQQVQIGLHSEFQDGQSYITKPCKAKQTHKLYKINHFSQA